VLVSLKAKLLLQRAKNTDASLSANYSIQKIITSELCEQNSKSGAVNNFAGRAIIIQNTSGQHIQRKLPQKARAQQ
jgi:hypothetical protein